MSTYNMFLWRTGENYPRIIGDNSGIFFSCFFIKIYVVGTH